MGATTSTRVKLEKEREILSVLSCLGSPVYFPVDACVDGVNLSLLAISSLQSLDKGSMLTGFGITSSSILSTCSVYREMHSLAPGMLTTMAGPGHYCLPFLQVSTSVENIYALVFKNPRTVICVIPFRVYANIQHHCCPGHRKALGLSTVPGFAEQHRFLCPL